MAVSIYYSVFDTPLSEPRFERLLAILPEQARRKVLRFYRWEDAHASLLGKHLLLHAFEQLGRQGDLEAVLYTSAGRPYWTDGPDFNISHSGNMVVCAVDTSGRVGIDIEQNRGIDFRDFREQFTENEWQRVIGAPDPMWQFYQYWTMKEAVAKANGVGIVELPAVHILSDSAVELQGFTWTLTPLTLQETYAGHLATEANPAFISIEKITF